MINDDKYSLMRGFKNLRINSNVENYTLSFFAPNNNLNEEKFYYIPIENSCIMNIKPQVDLCAKIDNVITIM